MKALDRTQAHAQTTRTRVSDMVAQLNAALGTTLVALMANASERSQPIRWTGPVSPPIASEQRLRAAYEAWLMVASNEGEGTARAWFIGTNPCLENKSPVEVLRESEDNAGRIVEAAAQLLANQ